MSESHNDGFLGRWSRRKQAVRGGQALFEPEIAQKTVSEPQKAAFLEPNTEKTNAEIAQAAPENIAIKNEKNQKELPPAPSLEDTKTLTPTSDFKPFMRADVQPEVKNAALKQLFKDPHFNTMDMMDVYVDDYSKPDPLPPEMLRKMAVTKFLGFWKEEEEQERLEKELQKQERLAHDLPDENALLSAENELKTTQSAALGDDADAFGSQSVAQSKANLKNKEDIQHDDPDLRLQPNHAAERQGARGGAG